MHTAKIPDNLLKDSTPNLLNKRNITSVSELVLKISPVSSSSLLNFYNYKFLH